MSFLRPDAISKFKHIQSFLLWLQMAYAVWQFVRTAKFFRIPYVMGSSLWHGLDSWIKPRKLILMQDDLDVDQDALIDLEVLLNSPPAGITIVAVGNNNVEVSFTHLRPHYTCLTTRHRAAHMVLFRIFCLNDPKLQFGRDDDLLLPKLHLIRRLRFEDALNHVLSGKGYSTLPQTVCFFDYSAREILNQDFVRFASIWPLILQARHFEFWSIIFSIFIILMDLFSYFANKLWRSVQYWVSRFVKWVILRSVSNKNSRVFWFTFMATISTRFECGNFVTQKASSKVVKQVLLATHIKFNKSKLVATVEPIVYDPSNVPRKAAGVAQQAAAQNIKFVIDGVEYSAKVEPVLSDQGKSSVHFQKHNIKVKDWDIADMAYFLQVCDYCDKFKFSPVKELDGDNNATCSSFAEIVQGVMTRNFVVCEFKTSQRLFFT